MAEIFTDSNGLKSAADDFRRHSQEMQKIAQSTVSVYSSLRIGSESVSRDIIQCLIGVSAVLLKAADALENFGSALDRVAALYLNAENSIAELSSGNAGSSLSSSSDLSDRNRQAAPQTVTENGGGSEEASKSEETDESEKTSGAEEAGRAEETDEPEKTNSSGEAGEYTEERLAERLMDRYLSSACADLLSQDRYSEDIWESSSREERKEFLKDFILDINRILGTDISGSVSFAELEDNISGRYLSATNSLIVSSRCLDRDHDLLSVTRTLIHEMRHCYQYTAGRHPEQFMVSDETLDRWRANFRDYKNIAACGYDAYVTQPIEWDSKNFAGQQSDIQGRTPDYAGSW